uniref:J domain-containing protein n=1 Tax=viral metagenome TaxID=1070528 RepID=A0A6C0K3S5_9ZZZZ
MGNIHTTLEMFDPSHVSIYKKLLQISDPTIRVQMIQTLLSGNEYVQSARRSGVYSHLLAYIARVNARERPAPLPGETAYQQVVQQPAAEQIQAYKPPVATSPVTYVTKHRSNEKAMNYFQNCLLVLGLEEEVALTEDDLRKAYKKAAVKVHPDKGGTEQEFEAVTRAYAYLTDILKRIHGGRTKEGVIQEPSKLQDTRKAESKDWEMVQPVRLNPKKLDMNAFNTIFEKTRIPDPDEEGYGDWLKGGESVVNGPNFGGKFNRDVFNRTFEEESKRRATSSALTATVPQALTLAPGHGVEIGRGASEDYTAPAGGHMRYTDLKRAYTTDNTFSNQVANLPIESRSFDKYTESRKKAPAALNDTELEAIQATERYQQRNEQQRSLRAAQEMVHADQYFQRMKQVVLMDGTGSMKKSDRHAANYPL